MTNLDSILKSRDITFPTKVHLVKAMVFPVVMYGCELDYKENWALKNWCFWTVVLEKTLKSPLDCKEIKPVNPKGNQPWIFIGRTDAETRWLSGKESSCQYRWHRFNPWIGTIPWSSKWQFTPVFLPGKFHEQMWELENKEGWPLKNWCFWAVVLEKTLKSPLDCKEIKPVNSKENQPWIFIGRTDTEVPILWPPDAKSWFTGKDPNAGKNRRQKEKSGGRGWDGWMASLTQWTWVWTNW